MAKVTHDANSKTTAGSTEGLGKGAYSPQVNLAEHPGDKQDTQKRADFEGERKEYEKFEVTIVVQGWVKPGGGGLWKPGEKVHVKSPMLIVDEELKLMAANFTQDNRSGTRTTLTLTRDTGGGGGGEGGGGDQPKYDYSPTKT
jgi:prophage tail gpP-like protein